MSRVYAYPVRDLPEGEALRLDTSPVIALFNVGDESYTISDRCSHDNASMSEGCLEDDTTVKYPLYATSFCPRAGEALRLPATDLLTVYAVCVDGSDVFVDIPEDTR